MENLLLRNKEMKKLIFVHVPKCGGTTMKNILGSVYGERITGDKTENENMRQLQLGRPLEPLNYEKRLDEKSDCIIGHFPLSKYSMLKERGWKFATWLRDPVDRMISIFTKRQRIGYMRYMPDIMEIDIFEYCRRLPNVYKCYLDLEILDFVGFTESYDEDLRRLENFLDCRIKEYKKGNVSTWKKLKISKVERVLLEDILKSDYEVYNKLRELCGKQKSY